MRDVFYYGKKPNVHPKEQFATSLDDARDKSTTEHFWIVNEFCNYKNFDWDFDFELLADEDVWAKDHNNVWPSIHQKDSGTWLCSKEKSDIIIYRTDVTPLKRKKEIGPEWKIDPRVDINSFDFSWHPDPTSPPYIHKWGCKFFPVEVQSYIEYHVPNATQIKYMNNITVDLLPQWDRWEIPNNIDKDSFDFSWQPTDTEPPLIYQFGTWIDDIHLEDGPRYVNSTNPNDIVNMDINILTKVKITYPKYSISTNLEDLIKEHPSEIFWAVRDSIDYSNFDFNWTPNKSNIFHINVFGSPESEQTQTYFVNTKMIERGYTALNFIEDIKINEQYLSTLFKKPDMFFIDKGNGDSQQRFTQLKEKFPNLQKTRFLNSWVDTISRCINKSKTELCWILNSELDYSSFNFDYYPNPWQMSMIHIFGTQWSHWGTTFLVNKETFTESTKYIKIIEHLSNLNFVKNIRAKATDCVYDVYLIDFENKETVTVQEQLTKVTKNRKITVVPYNNDYLTTFKTILRDLPEKKENFIWICSSICDYSTFDFSYICDPFSREQLHVFPSNNEKYGDTFLVNVNELKNIITTLETMEEYSNINFNEHLKVSRLEPPIFMHEFDTQVPAVKQAVFDFPYAVFVTNDNKNTVARSTEPISMWSKHTKNVLISSTGATQIVVPKEATTFINTQLYDYPYIKTSKKLLKSQPLDIVFLSNGEQLADENFEHLQSVTKTFNNRITRVEGINGRVAAYHAAAKASNTPWFFAVFAKLKVNESFDWYWQPDRLRLPMHYIFYAENPVNGLIYGHQAMLAYHKNLVLANQGLGLDFTLDDPHDVVELLSGVANFNSDPFSTWRTAFREAIKLRAEQSEISSSRLNTWLTIGEGNYAEFSTNGAKDGSAYYDNVNGEFDKLKLSYEWKWLKEHFEKRYGRYSKS